MNSLPNDSWWRCSLPPTIAGSLTTQGVWWVWTSPLCAPFRYRSQCLLHPNMCPDYALLMYLSLPSWFLSDPEAVRKKSKVPVWWGEFRAPCHPASHHSGTEKEVSGWPWLSCSSSSSPSPLAGLWSTSLQAASNTPAFSQSACSCVNNNSRSVFCLFCGYFFNFFNAMVYINSTLCYSVHSAILKLNSCGMGKMLRKDASLPSRHNFHCDCVNACTLVRLRWVLCPCQWNILKFSQTTGQSVSCLKFM